MSGVYSLGIFFGCILWVYSSYMPRVYASYIPRIYTLHAEHLQPSDLTLTSKERLLRSSIYVCVRLDHNQNSAGVYSRAAIWCGPTLPCPNRRRIDATRTAGNCQKSDRRASFADFLQFFSPFVRATLR